MRKTDIRLLLDNIRSAHNVGSIFRTAEAAGASHIYCTGTTPAPVDRFGRKRSDVAKVALGAENLVAWEYTKRPGDILKRLKGEGFEIVAIEQDARSVDYRTFKMSAEKVAFILGNEVGGISKKLLDAADQIIEIPLNGKKESLNVSVVAGIVLFRVRN